VVAAIPGGFKTGFLGNFAVNSFLEGKNALVYTFETARERLAMRYYANVIGMDKKEMLLDEDTFKEKAKEKLDDMEGDLIIKEYNANTVCANDLMAHIDDLKRYKNWEPDIVIIDYILIMLTNDKRLSSENSFKYYKTISEEIRNIGKTYDVPVLSATQINREGMSDRGGSKAFITAKDIAESRGIYDTCDWMGIITQTAKEKEKNKYNLYIDKSRNERTGMRLEFTVNYDHMRLEEGAIHQ
jgi:replicative DNA helicase